jgi:hypothetical protein
MRGSQNAGHEQERAEHLRRKPTLSLVWMVAKGRPHFDLHVRSGLRAARSLNAKQLMQRIFRVAVAADGYPVANTKKQMSLDLEDLQRRQRAASA